MRSPTCRDGEAEPSSLARTSTRSRTGPGINYNGSGSGLVLEVARQARRLGLRPARGLRFAFWGAEELGLIGSSAYVRSLSTRERGQLLAVLNFDMVGSPNYGRFVYDGGNGPPGSARIEGLFRAYFAARRQSVEEVFLEESSDHAPFAQAGLPVGGLFTGADARKEADLARRFGGAAGRPYDACYHRRATRSRTSTSASSARWPMPRRWSRSASRASPTRSGVRSKIDPWGKCPRQESNLRMRLGSPPGLLYSAPVEYRQRVSEGLQGGTHAWQVRRLGPYG
jgi:Zn-dependent M28 family amino/carboxypeptidase